MGNIPVTQGRASKVSFGLAPSGYSRYLANATPMKDDHSAVTPDHRMQTTAAGFKSSKYSHSAVPEDIETGRNTYMKTTEHEWVKVAGSTADTP
jgi:hypothetical protein